VTEPDKCAEWRWVRWPDAVPAPRFPSLDGLVASRYVPGEALAALRTVHAGDVHAGAGSGTAASDERPPKGACVCTCAVVLFCLCVFGVHPRVYQHVCLYDVIDCGRLKQLPLAVTPTESCARAVHERSYTDSEDGMCWPPPPLARCG
jgi:hypothetical protein